MASSAEGNAETKPATFAGRLNLQAFAFDTASSPSSLRRSPRHHDTSGSPQALLAPAGATDADAVSYSSLKRRGISSDASAGSSPSPTKKRGAARGRSSGYAPPSVYAHLKGLTDALGPDLLVMMVGLNPGVRTAQSGHAYAHPSNLFWKLMHSSGVTTRLCRPEEDQDMPRLFHVGLTNIVARPSRNGAELSKGEMDEGVAVLEAKARAWRPEAVCFVGKSIWESVWRVRHGRALAKKEFKYGWQDESEIFASVPGDGDGDEGWRGRGAVQIFF
ncbi:unnamed protein product [Parascedosporium putredinis]|uniref:Uracil-DNA glycosylase-like domain-containing protein n=1 Tax=Parascedosporium putredinis TaxID=1442378 RepID=A0A9P1ME95_9PEZI|nr:unnamed protein product [Parascedosporium putredinis]CAI8002179.1 unnamed protein product [Parascedosporium putredinis]